MGSVLDFGYAAPPLTVKAAADDAKSSADEMRLISTTIPLAALVTGSVLMLTCVAIAVVRRRRAPTTTTPAVAPQPQPQPRELTRVG